MENKKGSNAVDFIKLILGIALAAYGISLLF